MINTGATVTLDSSTLSIGATTGIISVYSTNSGQVGTHTVTVSVNLASYTSITSTLATFTIEIIGCIITGFTMIPLSPTNDQTYTISHSALPWSLVGSSTTTQVPPCGYVQTVSSDTVPTFVTASSGATINYSAYTRNVAFAGTVNISVTSTLIGYNFSPPRDAP